MPYLDELGPQPKLTFLDKLAMTWPARAVQGMWSGAKLPGDVYAGKVDPTSDEGIQRATELAGLGFTGGLTRAAMAPAVDGMEAGIFGGRVFHGSPNASLGSVSASPPARQFDNATSQLGAFFAPDEGGAKRYAGEAGKVYPTDISLKNEYEMPVSEFLRLQAPNKAADGKLLPGEMWASRAEELKAEAVRMRAELEAAGHDGIIIRDSKGNIKEVVSFADVPLGR